MNCICCGDDDDHNRVAIERASGDPVGTICTGCEGTIIQKLPRSMVLTMASCIVCGDESEFLFPEWEFIAENGSEITEFEFDVSLNTPSLCLSCLSDVQAQPKHEPIQYARSE
jgi:hypothetical protein